MAAVWSQVYLCKSHFGILLGAAFALWGEGVGAWRRGPQGSQTQICLEVMPVFLLTICFQIKNCPNLKKLEKERKELALVLEDTQGKGQGWD